MTAEESSEEEEKCTREFEPSCFLDVGSKLVLSRGMKTFLTNPIDNETGSAFLEESQLYQDTEPPRKHLAKTGS